MTIELSTLMASDSHNDFRQAVLGAMRPYEGTLGGDEALAVLGVVIGQIIAVMEQSGPFDGVTLKDMLMANVNAAHRDLKILLNPVGSA